MAAVATPPVMPSARIARLDSLGDALRALLIAAVVIGALAGALGCAIGMVAGGHGALTGVGSVAQTGDRADDAAHGSHHAEAHQVVHVADGRAERPADAPAVPDRPEHEAGHPGMACVVDVDLRFPELVADRPCLAVDPRPAPWRFAERADGPEPPVPRLS